MTRRLISLTEHYSSKEIHSWKALIAVLGNIDLEGYADSVTVVVGRGDDFNAVFADAAADYVYIGADHRYSQAINDISRWLPKVRPGGVICGHAYTRHLSPDSDLWKYLMTLSEQDYYGEHGVHFGLVRAVQELRPGFETEETIWWKF